MAEARFCPACGAERAVGAGFCGTCGQAFVTSGGATSASNIQPPAGEAPPGIVTQTWVVDPPAPPRTESRTFGSSRPAAIAIGVLLVLLVGAIVWSAGTSQTLATTQSQLSITTQQLAGATTDLAATRAQATQLGSDKGELTSANGQLASDKAQLTTSVARLTDQVAKQAGCIAALQANATEIERISELQRVNFNRLAKGSAWAKADTAALHDYYLAYSAAFDGRYSTANSWIAKGNAQIKITNTQIGIMNAATKTIGEAGSALSAALTQSVTTCGF